MNRLKIDHLKKIFGYIKKNFKKTIVALIVCVLFIVYMIAKCTVGVPILNVGSALKKAPKAMFVYVDKSRSVHTCYYYVLFKSKEMYTFCGNANTSEGSDIFCDGYISKITKARSKYISKDDYDTIMNWAYEADFYSEDIILPEIWEKCRMYYHNGEVRTLSDNYTGMIESSEYIFKDLFNNDEFYDSDLLYNQNPEDRFTWWYDGKRYIPRIIIGYNGDIYYSGKKEKEVSEDQ